jgi:chemotaxis response regulator CheB
MAERSVFVIWTNPLFHETVRLILQQPDVRLVGASSDRADAMSKVAALNPDVVVIEETGSQDVETMSILMTAPIVIRLGLADNELSVYQRQHRMAANAEDLVRMIVEGLSD